MLHEAMMAADDLAFLATPGGEPQEPADVKLKPEAAGRRFEKPAFPFAHVAAWEVPPEISEDEWSAARSAPDCIVENYLFADVALLIAPGGTGKTTLIIYEAVHIALGLPLYGLDVRKPGPVLILTAEDTREMLIARLRAISEAMGLSPAQRRTVQSGIRISDLSGGGCKLTAVLDDVVRPNHLVDEIIAAGRDLHPVLVVIDPAVSFGVGESRVNDAEQGLIEAARRIRRAWCCCIRYVHHSGKQNARDKSVDQYAGRGGSAFADGARMVAVLASHDAGEWHRLTGCDLLPGETALQLARPKLSYCAPQQPLYLVRDGYGFRSVEKAANERENVEAVANQLWQLLTHEMGQGRYHSANSLEDIASDSNLTRQQLRRGLSILRASLRIEERAVPGHAGKGGRHRYLHPIDSPKHDGEATEKTTDGSP